MPETAKNKNETVEDERQTEDESGARSEDRCEKSYYYDDAHGYEIYNPDEEDEEDDVETAACSRPPTAHSQY